MTKIQNVMSGVIGRTVLVATALCVAAYSPLYAAEDELGTTPKHWYRFIGGLRPLGATSLTWSANPSVTVDSDIEGSKCAIGPDTGNGGSGSAIDFGTGNWTVVVRGRMDPTTGSILLCLGNPMGTGSKDSSVSLTYEGNGMVGVSPCTNGSAGPRGTSNNYNVPDATEVFHTYALQFTKAPNANNSMLALWVDGVKIGEFKRDMTARNYSTFTFFGTPTKTVGKSTFVLGATTMTSAVSDFRVYQRLLTADEMKTLANPPVDEIGYRPVVWYPLNASLHGESAGFAQVVTFTNDLAAYTVGRDGIANTAVSAAGSSLIGSGVPWGGASGTAGGDWTFVLDLKGEDNANAVYFGTGGDFTHGTYFALASGGAGKVRLDKYSNASTYATAFTVDVPDASSAFHQYAIVRSGANIQLYVDGVYKNQVARDNPGQNGFTLLKSIGGNGVNGLFDATTSVIDDFRMYKRVLTSAELDAIRGAAHDELGGTPTHWYKFDGTLASSGRRELGLEGAFSGAAFDTSGDDGAILATGDRPYGTNVAWRANNWTIVLKAKSVDTDNAVLASFGSSLSSASASIALTSAGAGRIALSGFGDGYAHADLITADVADASSAFHTYAIVREGGNVSLWVDAVCAGTIARANDPTFNGFAFFTVHDGLGNTSFVAPSSGAAIADFRFYDRVLTQREQVAISGNASVVTEASWTGEAGDGLVSSPGNWACTNMFGVGIPNAVPGAATAVRFTGDVAVQIPAGTVWEYDSLSFDCTLTNDCDWSGLAAEEIAGTIDIAGNELMLAGLLGYGTVTDTEGGGTLRLAVGSGATVNGSTLTLSGGLKLVKDGGGTYIATKTQTYTGGTDVAAGVAKCGANGDALPFGASGSTIAVASGAELDANGKINQYPYPVRLDGGTLANRGASQGQYDAGFARVSLTDDSSVYMAGSICIGNKDYAVTTLDLGGHMLTVNSTGNNMLFRLYNCDATNGTLKIQSNLAYIVLRHGVRAATVAFDIGGTVHPYDDILIGDLTLRANSVYNSAASSIIDASGTFTPLTEGGPNVRLLDGAVFDLTGWSGTFRTVNPSYSDWAMSFASGANVTVNLAGRTDLLGIAKSDLPLVVQWVTEPDATFSLDPETAIKFKVKKAAIEVTDGETTTTVLGLRLYRHNGTMIIVR